MASAAEIRAGKIYVEVGSKDGPLKKGLAAAEARLRSFGAGLVSIGKKLAGLGLVGIAGLGVLAKKFADSGTQLKHMSSRTGLSVEALGELGHAAKLSGSSIQDLETGVKKMQKFLDATARGGQEGATTLARLGVSLRELKGQTPDKQLETLLGAMGGIENPTKRAALAMQVFGKSGTSLLPMAMSGTAGIKAMREEAIKLGRMSTEDALKAVALRDAWDKVTFAFGNVVNLVGSALAPSLMSLFESITNGVAVIGDWVQACGGLGGAASAAWIEVQIAFLSGLDALDGLTGGWVSRVQGFFGNFSGFALLAWQNTKIGAVVLFNDLAFFFTDKLPAAAAFFVENWRDIFRDIWQWTKTVFTNLASNLVAIIKNIPGLIRGSVTFAELWTPLTEGFQRATKEMNLPERVQSDLEKKMIEERDKMRANLQEKLAAVPKDRADKIRELQADLAKLKEDATKARDEKAGIQPKKPPGVGNGLDQEATKMATLGTFNAFAAASLGRGIQDRIAKATEKTAIKTEEMVNVVKTNITGGIVVMGA